MEPNISWIDLSEHGAALSVFRFPDNKIRVVLSGLKDGSSDWAWAEERGFRPSPNRLTLFSMDTRIDLGAFQSHFPRSRRISVPRNQLVRMVSPGNREKNEIRSAIPLGLNHLGQQVYEGATGRFVRSESNAPTILEGDMGGAVFLRATDAQNMALCADGLVLSMVNGAIVHTDDLRRFAATIHGQSGKMEVSNPLLRVVQEAVEAALQRRVETEAHRPLREVFELSVALVERQPPMAFRTSESVRLQQYSTPVPMAIAAQNILGDTREMKVLEPTIGNGSLVSCLPDGTQVTGYEIDPDRVAQLKMSHRQIDVRHGDFLSAPKGEFDAVIANPPFGGLEKAQVVDGLSVTRIDHLILMRSLQSRKDQGRSVFIIGADSYVDSKAGQVQGGSKNLFNWLADHYQLESVVEVDGRLYEKQGASFPVRMVVVGDRRTPEDIEYARQSKKYRLEGLVPVLRTWGEVWSFSEKHRPAPETSVSPIPPQSPRAVPNEWQTPYVASSSIGEASSMIPHNMQRPLSIALDALEENYGLVDEYVSRKLQMSQAVMAEVFTPEQVDGIALAIARCEEGRGLIIGDQTGLGKGRQLAALTRYAMLNGEHVVFLTEKPNLFSDFWRDFRDICIDRNPQDLFKPFILNNAVSIKDDRTNSVVFPSLPSATIQRITSNAIAPTDEGYTVTLATYSQFNREMSKSVKSSWLGTAAAGSLMLLDESHNAAGDSNTAKNVASAVEKSLGCIYSSATFAKNAKNMSAYSKVFPPSVSGEDLPEIIEAGGDPLMEILSSNLAEDGVMVRREHDMSNLAFNTVDDVEHMDRNKALSDQLSEILFILSSMSGDVEARCRAVNAKIKKDLERLSPEQRKGSRMGVSSVNFGSRLYNIMRQFQMAIKVDVVAEQSIQHLEAGRKPVIVVEQTMESLLVEILENADDPVVEYDENGDLIENEEQSSPLKGDGQELASAPTFRDLLYRMLDKINTVVSRDDYGVSSRISAVSLASSEDQVKAWEELNKTVKTMIYHFPDLPVSGIDLIRERIEEAGYSCGEISGRKMTTHSRDDGSVLVSPRVDDRLKTIHEFNNEGCDALILTRAGSTGISLHAGEKFADQRQRSLLELQIPNNVAERLQFFGRVNRKGQVSEPLIYTISSGLPSETRILAMQNAKLRKLSANTQSNRNNVAETKDIPDILNEIGDRVARQFLESNPHVAYRLGIDLPKKNDPPKTDNFYVNKLTGRIALLPVAEQTDLLELLFAEFKEVVATMEASGINPFKTVVHDWKARVVSRELYDGVDGDDTCSVFDRPVYLMKIEWDEDIKPIRFDAVEKRVKAGIESLILCGAEPDEGNAYVLGSFNGFQRLKMDSLIEKANIAFAKVIDRILPEYLNEAEGVTSLRDVLNLKEDNPVKRAEERRRFLVTSLAQFHPGRMFSLGIGGESFTAIVVSLRTPENPAHQHLLGKYEVGFAVPGETRLRFYSLHAISNNTPSATVNSWDFLNDSRVDNSGRIKARFDTAPAGQVTRSRCVLDGNLFRAAQIALEDDIGFSGIWTDDCGERRRGIIMRGSVDTDQMQSRMVRVPSAQVALQLVRDMLKEAAPVSREFPLLGFSSSSLRYNKDAANIRVSALPGSEKLMLCIDVPGAKQAGGRFFLNQELINLTGGDGFSGDRRTMSALIKGERNVEKAIALLYSIQSGLYLDSSMRNQVENATRTVQTASMRADHKKTTADMSM